MPNTGQQRKSTGDLRQALQEALLLQPPALTEVPTILSVDPSVWDSQYRVIDIGPLLHVKPTMYSMGAELEHSVALAFQSVGWPLQRIAEDFRPNLKSPERIDIALLGDFEQCLVAVEVKRNTGPDWPRRRRDARARLAIVAPDVLWHCVTDGITYELLSNVTGTRVELAHAFSLESLRTGDFEAKPAGGSDTPTSFSELREILKGAGWLVLDQTLPLMRLGSENQTKAVLEQELGQLLPPVTDLTQALLAWIAQVDGLTWFSTFGTASILRGESSQWLRNELGRRFWVRAVIEVGGIFPDVSPSMRFCIIHLGSTPGQAFLASIPGDASQALNENVRAAKQFLAGEKPSIGFTADVERTGRWAVSLYDPELDKLEAGLAGIGTTKALSEVCTIIRGVSGVKHSGNATDGIPLATRMGHLEVNAGLEELRRVPLTPETERCVLRRGDLVVPVIKGGPLQCALVQTDTPLVASDRLFVLRVTDAALTPEFLAEYLNSALACRLIGDRYSGSAGLMLSVRSLGSLPVPMLGRPVALDLREIGTLEAALRRRADELRLQRQTLFGATSPQSFVSAVQDLRRKGELLSRSVLRADDLGFQVANFYPFPIAYGYRLLASISNPTDLYKEQLRIGENILAFLASVAMSLIQSSDRTSVGLNVREIWDGGASPGHWRDIVGKCCKVLSTYKEHPLASCIVALNITSEKRGFGAAMLKLIMAKNAFKHDRGPRTEEDFVAETKEMQLTLDACIKALAFFTEHPIRQVVDQDVTRTGEVRLRCLTLVGDHPGLPQEEIPNRIPLTKRDLYIAAADVGWVTLFPLLVARNCPACKTRETFFIDKWNRGKATAKLKSFERGHEEESNDVLQNMGTWL